MREDFLPSNVELWLVNWKRAGIVNECAKSWLQSWNFNRINIIVNHSSITIDNFDKDIKSKIKIWNNVLRHNSAIGPTSHNYNDAYIHTFLSGKKYCICSHDNIKVKKGWSDLIINSDYDVYFAPQGDMVHLMTVEGLKKFGWWDVRYTTNAWAELSYLSTIVNKAAIKKIGKASLVDIHGWEPNPQLPFVVWNGERNILKLNDIGLSDYWQRMNQSAAPKSGLRGAKFDKDSWNDTKWGGKSPTSAECVINGPKDKTEIDYAPWLDLETLQTANCDIK